MILNPLLQFSPSTLLTVYIDSCIEEIFSIYPSIESISGKLARIFAGSCCIRLIMMPQVPLAIMLLFINLCAATLSTICAIPAALCSMPLELCWMPFAFCSYALMFVLFAPIRIVMSFIAMRIPLLREMLGV
jgi:hypothetical protein